MYGLCREEQWRDKLARARLAFLNWRTSASQHHAALQALRREADSKGGGHSAWSVVLLQLIGTARRIAHEAARESVRADGVSCA
jgi:hypothetical protein